MKKKIAFENMHASGNNRQTRLMIFSPEEVWAAGGGTSLGEYSTLLHFILLRNNILQRREHVWIETLLGY